MNVWDQLDVIAPQYNGALTVAPQEVIPFDLDKNQVVSYTDDGRAIVTCRSDSLQVVLELKFKNISEADADTIIDMWINPYKANGRARSFTWENLISSTPSQSYTVRFLDKLKGSVFPWGSLRHSIETIKVLVEGKAPTL